MPGIIRQLPQHKPWMVAIGAIAMIVVVAVCSFSSFLLVQDDAAIISDPLPTQTVLKRDIESRQTDPKPLTVADVFPTADIVVDPAFPPYKLIGQAQATEDCRVAAEGEARKLLLASGCSQVVRASFAASDSRYFVTGGVINLTDAATALKFATDVRGVIEGNQGRFTGYVSDSNVNVALYRAASKPAWEVRGHFLIYTVIVRADMSAMEADDAGAKIIVFDILKTYLRDKVLAEWETDKTSPAPGTASPSP